MKVHEFEGKVIVRTRRSHGNKDLPGHLIRQQLKLNEKQLGDLISCSVSMDNYVTILRAKGLIPAPEPSSAAAVPTKTPST
jgi:hypothetical protein